MLTMSATVEPMGTICAGFDSPISNGPNTVVPPSSYTSLVDACAECSPGMTNTLAGPASRQNG